MSAPNLNNSIFLLAANKPIMSPNVHPLPPARPTRKVPLMTSVPKMIVLSVACLTAATASSLPAAAAENPNPTQDLAYYSPTPQVPWAGTYQGLRTYYSTNHPEYDLQSYVFFGGLKTPDGKTTAFNVLAQRTDRIIPGFSALSYAVVGASFNQETNPGYKGMGQQGFPDVTLPLNQTKYPWSIRSEETNPSVPAQPSFIDMRVVEGKVGKKGAVYEISCRFVDW